MSEYCLGKTEYLVTIIIEDEFGIEETYTEIVLATCKDSAIQFVRNMSMYELADIMDIEAKEMTDEEVTDYYAGIIFSYA